MTKKSSKPYKGTSIDNITDLYKWNKTHKLQKQHPNDHYKKGICIRLNDKNNTEVWIPKSKKDKVSEIKKKYEDYVNGTLIRSPKELQNIFKGDPVLNEQS